MALRVRPEALHVLGKALYDQSMLLAQLIGCLNLFLVRVWFIAWCMPLVPLTGI